MTEDNRSPQDQMDGVDQCGRCGARFTQDDDEDRCPECGRMLAPEFRITFEMQKRCPWGGPIAMGEEVEVHGEGDSAKWVWITQGVDICSREHAVSECYRPALDRLLGYLTRMDLL